MKNHLRLLSGTALLLVAGCLASAPQAPVNWTLDVDALPPIGSVTVFAPYDTVRFTVLRPDGSLAFDACNVFAAKPSTLLRNATQSGRKDALAVRRLALDFSAQPAGEACADVTLTSPDGVSRRAAARATVVNGNYTQAFTQALAEACRKAGAQ